MAKQTRPTAPDTPRGEPCARVNPALWQYFCARLREIPPAALWSEADVVQSLDNMESAQRATLRTLSGLAAFFNHPNMNKGG